MGHVCFADFSIKAHHQLLIETVLWDVGYYEIGYAPSEEDSDSERERRRKRRRKVEGCDEDDPSVSSG